MGEVIDCGVTVDENAVNSDKYYARMLNVEVNDTQISSYNNYICEADTYKYVLSAWLHSDVSGYIISNDAYATVLVDTGKRQEDGTAVYESYSVRRINVNGAEPYAKYELTIDIAPSWTLVIPSSQTITFGVENNPVNLCASVSGVESLSDYVPIYVFAKYDGYFIEKSDGSKSILYTIENESVSYLRNKLFKVNTSVKEGGEDARADHLEAEDAVIQIWRNEWDIAKPGSYETTVTYTSSLDDLTGQNG